jgi:hypothetical protein
MGFVLWSTGLVHVVAPDYEGHLLESLKCLYFSVLNLVSQVHFFTCIHTLMCIRKNKEILNSNKEICSVL